MSERLHQLAAKRETLLAQTAVQRNQFVHNVREIETHLAGIDRGVETVRRFIKHPIVLAGGIALVALIGPRKLLGFGTRAAFYVSTGRRVMRLLRR